MQAASPDAAGGACPIPCAHTCGGCRRQSPSRLCFLHAAMYTTPPCLWAAWCARWRTRRRWAQLPCIELREHLLRGPQRAVWAAWCARWAAAAWLEFRGLSERATMVGWQGAGHGVSHMGLPRLLCTNVPTLYIDNTAVIPAGGYAAVVCAPPPQPRSPTHHACLTSRAIKAGPLFHCAACRWARSGRGSGPMAWDSLWRAMTSRVGLLYCCCCTAAAALLLLYCCCCTAGARVYSWAGKLIQLFGLAACNPPRVFPATTAYRGLLHAAQQPPPCLPCVRTLLHSTCGRHS